jgi:Na+/H+ antiporter NhaC
MVMLIFKAFLPIITFIGIFLGSGVYFSCLGYANAFYQVSPIAAIFPALILAWILHNKSTDETMQSCVKGASHPDIVSMCLIFILAAVFSQVTYSIGSVDATVNCAMSLIKGEFLLIGLFLTAAFISTAIGTSMGTIATIGPIAVGLSQQGVFPMAIAMATVIGGAIFGDNLSLVSDTTIAAVASQEANMIEKLKLNGIVAVISALLTVLVLSFYHVQSGYVSTYDYQFILITPYLLLVLLSAWGINVFIGLMTSIATAVGIGYFWGTYSLIQYSADVVQGCLNIQDVLILSLLIGVLSGLINSNLQAGIEQVVAKIGATNKRLGQLIIVGLVSICDVLIANNTIAIIMVGPIARTISQKFSIKPHVSAAWLDIFSCVFQGIIPYGAQILLASSLAGLSPLALVPHVYYCYILGLVSIGFILSNKEF